MQMTLDQLLYVIARIHTWDKSVMEIVERAIAIVHHSGLTMKAQKAVADMDAKGLSPVDMLRETLGDRFDELHAKGLSPAEMCAEVLSEHRESTAGAEK